jgi:HEPN domain-containing protein
MEQQLKYDEWFFQSDYDLETAQYMLQAERNVYCIFMCHLSLEKALKGLFIKRLNQFPPKIHDLMYFVENLDLEPENTHKEFLIWMNRKGITTRYTEDLKKMINQFPCEYTENIYQQAKAIQQWIKHQ